MNYEYIYYLYIFTIFNVTLQICSCIVFLPKKILTLKKHIFTENVGGTCMMEHCHRGHQRLQPPPRHRPQIILNRLCKNYWILPNRDPNPISIFEIPADGGRPRGYFATSRLLGGYDGDL